MPLPLSLGNLGSLKQKIHLKSSLDKRAAFGLYKLKLVIFLVLCLLLTCVPVGLLLVVLVVVLDLDVVERLCDVGVDLDEWLTDLDLLVTALDEGVGDDLVVVRTVSLYLRGVVLLLGAVNWCNLFIRCVM